jgi:hypothetical protein
MKLLKSQTTEPSVLVYEFGPFRLETEKRRLLREEVPVMLTPKCYETLLALVRNRDRVLEKSELMEMLWPDSFVDSGDENENQVAAAIEIQLEPFVNDNEASQEAVTRPSARGFAAKIKSSHLRSAILLIALMAQ